MLGENGKAESRELASGARRGYIFYETLSCCACKIGLGMYRLEIRVLRVCGGRGLLCHRRLCDCMTRSGTCMDEYVCLGASYSVSV
jgi:hypothetical protein